MGLYWWFWWDETLGFSAGGFLRTTKHKWWFHQLMDWLEHFFLCIDWDRSWIHIHYENRNISWIFIGIWEVKIAREMGPIDDETWNIPSQSLDGWLFKGLAISMTKRETELNFPCPFWPYPELRWFPGGKKEQEIAGEELWFWPVKFVTHSGFTRNIFSILN